MTVKDIIKRYLIEKDFDGLAGNDCGCTLDDFMCCYESDCSGCVPAYKCNPSEEYMDDWGKDCGFMMSTSKKGRCK